MRVLGGGNSETLKLAPTRQSPDRRHGRRRQLAVGVPVEQPRAFAFLSNSAGKSKVVFIPAVFTTAQPPIPRSSSTVSPSPSGSRHNGGSSCRPGW